MVGPGYGASRKDKLLRFGVIVSNDSRLVARGSKLEKAATQGGANLDPCPEGWDDHVPGQVFGECCSKALAGCMSSIRRIEAKLKHRKRLYRKPRFKAKIEVTATDEFGQTTSDEVRFLLRRCPKTIRQDGPDADLHSQTGEQAGGDPGMRPAMGLRHDATRR